MEAEKGNLHYTLRSMTSAITDNYNPVKRTTAFALRSLITAGHSLRTAEHGFRTAEHDLRTADLAFSLGSLNSSLRSLNVSVRNLNRRMIRLYIINVYGRIHACAVAIGSYLRREEVA